MKKIILITTVLALVIMGFSFYFASLSNILIKQYDNQVKYNQHKTNEILKLENRKKCIEQLNQNNYNYKSLELNQVDFIKVNNCLQSYLTAEVISDNCIEYITNSIIKNYGKTNFIKSIIGHSINYRSLSINYYFPKDLFDENASLSKKIILSYLNTLRDSKKIEKEFNTYKKYFYRKITKRMYNKFFDTYITQLISTYQNIERKEDKEAYFKNIYFKAESQNLHSKYWEVTFWKRRALEKNDTVIYNMLTEIKRHYKQ